MNPNDTTGPEPLPPWVDRAAIGNFQEDGAILETRDGRRIGNATLVLYWSCAKNARIVTDAGTWMTLTEGELAEFFYPPRYIRRGFRNFLLTPGRPAVE
jgi:hypothetical protein